MSELCPSAILPRIERCLRLRLPRTVAPSAKCLASLLLVLSMHGRYVYSHQTLITHSHSPPQWIATSTAMFIAHALLADTSESYSIASLLNSYVSSFLHRIQWRLLSACLPQRHLASWRVVRRCSILCSFPILMVMYTRGRQTVFGECSS